MSHISPDDVLLKGGLLLVTLDGLQHDVRTLDSLTSQIRTYDSLDHFKLHHSQRLTQKRLANLRAERARVQALVHSQIKNLLDGISFCAAAAEALPKWKVDPLIFRMFPYEPSAELLDKIIFEIKKMILLASTPEKPAEMPLTKQQSRRAHVAKRYPQLAQGKGCVKQDQIVKKLMDECGVARATIMGDLAALRNANQLPRLRGKAGPKELSNQMHIVDPKRRPDI